MFVKNGSFSFATGVLSQSVTLSFRPKAIVFWTVGAAADNVNVSPAQPSYGFWADCGQEGYRTRSRFYYRSLSIGSGINSHKDFLATVGSYTGMIRSRSYAFTVDSVDASGFNITWTAAPPNGTIWYYQAIGGEEVRAYINASSLTIPGSAASGFVASVSGVPFRPQAVMAIANHGQIATTAGADISLGFMDEAGAQFSVSNNITVVNSSGAYGQSYTQYRNDSVVAGASTEMRLVGTLKADGVSLLGYEGAGNASARSLEVDFLFLSGVRSKASFIQAPTTNITQNVNVGFKPRAAFSLGWHLGIQIATDPVTAPNGYYLGGSVMLGGVNLLTGDKAVGQLNYTHAANGASGRGRNNLFWAASQTSYADTDPGVYARWIATTAVSGTNVQLTYAGSNTKAAYIGLFTLGDITKPLEAIIASQAVFQFLRLGTPVMLSAALRAISDIYPQAFGTVGNLSQVSIGAVSTFDARLQLKARLAATISAISILNPHLRFSHSMHALIASTSTVWGSKPGNPAPLSGAIFASGSDFSVKGLKLTHHLVATIGARTRVNSRFRITIPTIYPAGVNDIPGTVNLHPNPSAERQGDLIGWFDEDGEQLKITQTTEQVWDGVYSVKHTQASGVGREVVARSFLGLEVTGLAPGDVRRRVQGQVRVYAPVGAAMEVFLRAEYTDGTLVAGESIPAIGQGGQTWPTPFNAPGLELDPLKVLLYVEVVTRTTSGDAFSFYVDGAQLEVDQGYGPTHFAIGTYGGNVGKWQGVPHASMTVRQPIPQVIHAVGRGGEFTVKGQMYRATWDNRWVEDISHMVIDCNVSMDTTREVTWQMTANFTWDGYQELEENFDWLAPVLTITYPDGTSATKQLGLYFLVPGGATRGEYERTVQVSAFDPLWLLARQGFTGAVRTAKAGVEERMRVVRDILDGAVLTGGDGAGTGPKRYSGPNSGKNWRKRREWSDDNDRLALVNEILQGAAMYPLWTIYNGEMRWRKMGEGRLRDRKPVRLWAANLPPGSRVDSTIPRVTTLSSEVVGAIKTTSAAMDAYDEILIVNDDPDTKRVRVRGRVKGGKKHKRVVTGRGDNRRVKKLRVPYVDDDATAEEIARALADQLSNRQDGVDVNVLPDPRPDYCHETVELAVWDAYGDEVAVGQFEVESVQWGFTPSTCLQRMKLYKIDNDLSEVVVTRE